MAVDAKVNLDDNALFRHPEYAAMRDLAEEDPTEVEAGKSNLNYVKLDGNVGCMVNGAGLAMATMDIINLAGGRSEEHTSDLQSLMRISYAGFCLKKKKSINDITPAPNEQ